MMKRIVLLSALLVLVSLTTAISITPGAECKVNTDCKEGHHCEKGNCIKDNILTPHDTAVKGKFARDLENALGKEVGSNEIVVIDVNQVTKQGLIITFTYNGKTHKLLTHKAKLEGQLGINIQGVNPQ